VKRKGRDPARDSRAKGLGCAANNTARRRAGRDDDYAFQIIAWRAGAATKNGGAGASP